MTATLTRRYDRVLVIEHDGRTMTAPDWSRELGGRADLVAGRVRDGWPLEDAVTAPPGTRRPVNGHTWHVGAEVVEDARFMAQHGEVFHRAAERIGMTVGSFERALLRDKKKRGSAIIARLVANSQAHGLTKDGRPLRAAVMK